MISFDWSSVLLFSSIVNAMLAIFIILFRTAIIDRKIKFWIISILLCISLILAERIIRFSDLEDVYPHLLFSTSPLFFFILPLLYLFQKRFEKMPRLWFLHFMIPLVMLFIFLQTITMESSKKLEMYFAQNIADPIWVTLGYFAFAVSYSVSIFLIGKKHKQRLVNQYADNAVEQEIFSNRLIFLVSILMLSIPISFLIQYLNLPTENLSKGLFIVFSLSSHIILILLVGNTSTLVSEEKLENFDNEPKEQSISLAVLKGDLVKYMDEEQPYLNQELSLQVLADKMHWSRSQLSMVINNGFDKNFYDFINEYRLKNFLESVENREHEEYSLDYIVKQAGFRSYVSFYRMFKRYKKMSPKAYLASIENST